MELKRVLASEFLFGEERFESHQNGIETRPHGTGRVRNVWFESHQNGIETEHLILP